MGRRGPKNAFASFLCALGWFVLGFAGPGISLFPLIVPPSLTIWDAAAPRDSQVFQLVDAAVLVPMILAYSSPVAYEGDMATSLTKT